MSDFENGPLPGSGPRPPKPAAASAAATPTPSPNNDAASAKSFLLALLEKMPSPKRSASGELPEPKRRKGPASELAQLDLPANGEPKVVKVEQPKDNSFANESVLHEVKASTEYGSNGTLCELEFSENVFQRLGGHMVRFECAEKNISFEQIAIVCTLNKAQIIFSINPLLSGERLVRFLVTVVGVQHEPVKFLWLNPSTHTALGFLKKEGFPSRLSEEKNDAFVEKISKMDEKNKASLVTHYAVLGQLDSLKILKDKYEMDLRVTNPISGENIFHIGIRENWPDVAQYASDFPEFFHEEDVLGVTPVQLLKWLPKDDESRSLLQKMPPKPPIPAI